MGHINSGTPYPLSVKGLTGGAAREQLPVGVTAGGPRASQDVIAQVSNRWLYNPCCKKMVRCVKCKLKAFEDLKPHS